MTAPAGELSLLLDKIGGILEASAAFVAQCALDGVTPSEQIFWQAYRPDVESDVVVPSALVYPMLILKVGTHVYRDFSPGCMQPQTVIGVHVSDLERSDDDRESALIFHNFYGSLFDDLGHTNYASQGLIIRTLTQTLDPVRVQRYAKTPKYNHWCAEFEIALGADF